MNEVYIWLIIIVILYILPEVFRQDKKRKGRGKYKYPQFPDFPQPPTEKKPGTTTQPQKPAADYPGFSYEYYQPPAKTVQQEVFFIKPKEVKETVPAPVTVPPPVDIPTVTSSSSPWQGALAPRILPNAIVLSELISPPRAYRPLRSNYGGRNRR